MNRPTDRLPDQGRENDRREMLDALVQALGLRESVLVLADALRQQALRAFDLGVDPVRLPAPRLESWHLADHAVKRKKPARKPKPGPIHASDAEVEVLSKIARGERVYVNRDGVLGLEKRDLVEMKSNSPVRWRLTTRGRCVATRNPDALTKYAVGSTDGPPWDAGPFRTVQEAKALRGESASSVIVKIYDGQPGKVILRWKRNRWVKV